MDDREKVVIQPQYIKKFKCIGSKCEDSCCIGWSVHIDHKTYLKYKNVKDEVLEDMMNKHVSRNRKPGHSKGSYAKVNMPKNLVCPFLTDEKLCTIQLKKGENYLSDVCATYPKLVNKINNKLERSATISCPEVARLALLNKDGIEFDEDKELPGRNIVRDKFKTTDLKLNMKPQKYLWELRIFTIATIQNRKYKLWKRLVMLGMFYSKLQDSIDENNINEIPNLIGKHMNLIDNNTYKEHFDNIPTQYNLQMKLLKEVIDKRFKSGIKSKRFLECFNEFLVGIMYNNESKIEDIAKRYEAAWEKYSNEFFAEHEYIFENYLVNYVFKNLVPFSTKGNVFDSYMMMVLHYSLIKMLLIGISRHRKGLNIDVTIKLIQSFAKTIEHSDYYLREILTSMKDNELNNMSYMTILLKN